MLIIICDTSNCKHHLRRKHFFCGINMNFTTFPMLLCLLLSADARRGKSHDMTELMTFIAPGCQTAGYHMCASSDPVLASIQLPPCCPGLVCREDPELPVTGDKFCMESEAIPEGGDCRVIVTFIVTFGVSCDISGKARCLSRGIQMQRWKVSVCHCDNHKCLNDIRFNLTAS